MRLDNGHYSLVIQPTAKGKSLCYQLVALQQKKLVFVFVPTLALKSLIPFTINSYGSW